jgi:hypothetical protein
LFIHALFLQTARQLVSELQRLKELIKTVPPHKQAQRYGNKAFKTWLENATAVGCEVFFLG